MNIARYRLSAWLLLSAIIFVTISPIEMRPGDIFSVDLDRALAFGLLSFAFMVAYPRHALLVGGLVVFGAGGIELLQMLAPGRHARLDDAVVKGAGAVAGLAAALICNALRARRRAFRPITVAMSGPTMPGRAEARQVPVKSKLTDAVYFSQEDGSLRIRMRNGEERLFEGVSEGDVAALVSSPSPGQYYLENIRPKYPKRAA